MSRLLSNRTSIPLGRWDIALGRRRQSPWHRVTPPQLFVGSFGLLVLMGTLGLKFLPGLYTGAELGWLDAVFTSSSAVCVTGLIVVDTATYFTLRGQAFLLLLIQLGGLGMITFTSLIIVSLGKRLSLRQQALSLEAADVAPHVKPASLLRDVVLFTLAFELLGALLLYGMWVNTLGWVGALWPAVFHSISAFCNAGFSTFSDSLMGFNRSPGVLAVVMALIVLGGIGFLTLEELRLHWQARRAGQKFRLSLHSRIVLVTTAILIVGGWVLFMVLERQSTLKGMPLSAQLSNALFLSVTARTAGFNAVDYAATSDATNFLTILLMMIGGSPGSTAGGIKTTTVALIGLLAWSRFRGNEVTSIASRSVPEETIQRAVGLFVVAFGLITAAILVFTVTDLQSQPTGHFLFYMFEAVSAFNTVGLSMGVTADLTPAGKWMAIILMFLGRVGPLTLAAALALKRPSVAGEFRYAYEDVVVG